MGDANRLLFTGDTFYLAPLYTHLEGSSFEDYAVSASRLAALAGDIDRSRAAAETPPSSATRRNSLSDKVSIYQKYPNYNFTNSPIFIICRIIILQVTKHRERTDMTYYSVLAVTPTSEDWIPDYIGPANTLVTQHGGKYLARTASHDRLEGDGEGAARVTQRD